MKDKLMPIWDELLLRKRYIIECINELLKNKANLVHSRHRPIRNFMMNLCSALTAYCFFDNKPEALPVQIEKSGQLELFAYWSYPELVYIILLFAWDHLKILKDCHEGGARSSIFLEAGTSRRILTFLCGIDKNGAQWLQLSWTYIQLWPTYVLAECRKLLTPSS